MRKVTLEELEQARKILAAKRYACGDGLLQDALEIAECLIATQKSIMIPGQIEYVILEELE